MTHPALTQLSEEERMFKDAVLAFARERVAVSYTHLTLPTSDLV